MPFVHSYEPEDESPPADRTVAGKGFYYDGEFVFGSPRFAPGKLDAADAGPALGWLRELGATAVRAKYDGGCDEGFAYLASAETADGTLSIDDLIARWSAGGKVTELPPPAHPAHTEEDRFRWVADEFADALARRFLGEGYGTGEYEMFGEFVADLRTGTFTDLRDAEPRDGAIHPEEPEEEFDGTTAADLVPVAPTPPPNGPLARLWRALFRTGTRG